MAFQLSQRELKRVADLAYNGRAYEVFLANNNGSPALTGEDTYAAWQAVELATANGYAPVTGTITSGSGAWDNTDGRYEFPSITATFTAAIGGVGLAYDTVCVRIGTETYLCAIREEAVILAPGQAQSYLLVFGADD